MKKCTPGPQTEERTGLPCISSLGSSVGGLIPCICLRWIPLLMVFVSCFLTGCPRALPRKPLFKLLTADLRPARSPVCTLRMLRCPTRDRSCLYVQTHSQKRAASIFEPPSAHRRASNCPSASCPLPPPSCSCAKREKNRSRPRHLEGDAGTRPAAILFSLRA